MDAFSFLQNQAALPAIKTFSAAVSAERRYLLQELSHYEAAMVLPTISGSFGFIGSYFGSVAYHETAAALAYGRRMNKIDVGMQADYTNNRAAGYSSRSSINVEGGIIFQISGQLRAGFHVFNPFSLQLKNNEQASTSFSAGIGYDGSENFHFEVVLQKVEMSPVNVCATFHYAPTAKIFFRTGISCAMPMLFAGAGILLQNIRVDVMATWHPYLGITPGFAVVLNKKN